MDNRKIIRSKLTPDGFFTRQEAEAGAHLIDTYRPMLIYRLVGMEVHPAVSGLQERRRGCNHYPVDGQDSSFPARKKRPCGGAAAEGRACGWQYTAGSFKCEEMGGIADRAGIFPRERRNAPKLPYQFCEALRRRGYLDYIECSKDEASSDCYLGHHDSGWLVICLRESG